MEEQEETKSSSNWLSQIVQLAILAWSLGVISISYFGNTVRQIDTTFAAGLLSASLSQFGLNVKNKDKNDKKQNGKTDPITGKKVDPQSGRLL
tara:strand:+ start:4442 stop:4720 length:279 start_codon:yes stop_codon:yes gene_type:complete